MNNIIKSQIYKTIKNKMTWFILVAVIILNSFTLMDLEDITLNGSVVASNSGALCISCFIFVGIVSCEIMGSDFLDKTINYEIMSGHNKAEVFVGRLVVALVTSVIGCIIIANILPITFSIINGWGDMISISTYLFRFMLLVIVQLKLVALIAMISFFARNQYASIGMVFGICFFEFMLQMLNVIEGKLNLILSVPSLYKTLDFTSGAFSNSDATFLLVLNVIEIIVFILIGYNYFKKKDME